MINEDFYDEMKETLIKNINDTFTLNLAISLWEDSKKYKVDSEFYKQGLKEIKKYAGYEMYYTLNDGNTDDSVMEKTEKEILQIIDKYLGD